jgi:hypothetical protein
VPQDEKEEEEEMRGGKGRMSEEGRVVSGRQRKKTYFAIC